MLSKNFAARRTAKWLLGVVLIGAVLQTLVAWCCQPTWWPRTSPPFGIPGQVIASNHSVLLLTRDTTFGSTTIDGRLMGLSGGVDEQVVKSFAAYREEERAKAASGLGPIVDDSVPSYGPLSRLPDLPRYMGALEPTDPGTPVVQVAQGFPFRSCYYVAMRPGAAGLWEVRDGVRISGPLTGWPGMGVEIVAIPLAVIWPGMLLNTVVYSLAVGMAIVALRSGRSTLRLRRNRCPSCGYSLAGQTAPGCPECGWKRAPATDRR